MNKTPSKMFKTAPRTHESTKYDVGITFGSFDLLHAGHCLMLKEAKKYCSTLIVGLQTDPTIDRPNKNRPVQSIVERAIQLNANKFVDGIIIYDTEASLVEVLKLIKPDVRIIGADWRGKYFTGKELHIPIIYNSRGHEWSSSALRKRIKKL